MTEERKAPLLVPLDGSLDASQPLEVAQAVAYLRGDDIAVLLVSAEPLGEEQVAEALSVPKEWLPRVTLLNTVGEPAEGICRVARDIEADVILMSSHGRTGDMRSLAGHVTLQVLQDPPCPVLVVRSALNLKAQARRLRHLRRVCVPLDGSAEAIWSVRVGSALAQQANARLFMLHVINDRPEVGAASSLLTYSDQSSYQLEVWQEEFVRSSFAVASRSQEVMTSVALRFGEPDREIIGFATEADCDLIVAAWSGRISEGRAKVVHMLLEQSPCPLLFVRAREPRPSA